MKKFLKKYFHKACEGEIIKDDGKKKLRFNKSLANPNGALVLSGAKKVIF